MKKNKIMLYILLIMFVSAPMITFAVPEKPPGGKPGGNGGSSSSNVSYTGKNTISSSINESDKTYESTTGSENAILVSKGESTINNCTITKSGDASGDNADFYGTNAAILTYNGAVLNINGGNITTNGSHANAVFSYGTGIININNATIKTENNNSGAVMVTGGGVLTANNVTAETSGNSSAPIRSDRGGGTLTVNNGTYISHGTGSPVIYSTADIIVNDATLTSTASEGVVVEGKNSVVLNNVTMEATNTKLNGNSETYKSIFIYQSMSGDADVGTSSFVAKNSKIINNKGEVIFVTNTNTEITLENNEIINNDSDGGFLKATTAKWGKSGSNGGNVALKLINQKISGDFIIDNISTLDLTLENGSVINGAINSSNNAKNVSLTISSDSVVSLTKDTYIDSLENEVSDNSNIYSNGLYKLYVDSKEVEINSSVYDNSNFVQSNNTDTISNSNSNNFIFYLIICFVIILVGSCIIIIVKKRNN